MVGVFMNEGLSREKIFICMMVELMLVIRKPVFPEFLRQIGKITRHYDGSFSRSTEQ